MVAVHSRQLDGKSTLTRTTSGLLRAGSITTDSLAQCTNTHDGANEQIVMVSYAYTDGSAMIKYMDNLVQDVSVQANYYWPTTWRRLQRREGNGLELMTRAKAGEDCYAEHMSKLEVYTEWR